MTIKKSMKSEVYTANFEDMKVECVHSQVDNFITVSSAAEYPARFILLDFYLWGEEGWEIKDVVYGKSEGICYGNIEMMCAATTCVTLQNVVHRTVRRHRQCFGTNGGHFDHHLRSGVSYLPKSQKI